MLELAITTKNIQNFELVKLLLDYQADPNIKAQDGRSMLEWAAATKNKDIITLFREPSSKRRRIV